MEIAWNNLEGTTCSLQLLLKIICALYLIHVMPM